MKKILIIEDNQDVRENTADILELANYEVCTAENGIKGVEMAKRIKPDVILCDIMMPEMDGYGVLNSLNKHKSTSSTPFIFLTAKTEKADVRKGMNLGADDYLTKPFEENELLEAVASRLKKHNFLKKEFSKDIDGISQFIDEAANYLNIEHITREYELKKHKKKDLIFMEGNAANSMFFVKSGTLKTYKTTEKGKEFVTGLYNSGDFVGQLSLLSNQGSYVESAAILEDTELFEISKADFITLIQGNKQVSNKFIHLISNNLIETQEHLVNVAYSTVRQRVAKVLLDLYKKRVLTNNDGEGINIVREDFAGLIGTATETAIRMLTDFKNEGLITIGEKRKINIMKKRDLEDVALFG